MQNTQQQNTIAMQATDNASRLLFEQVSQQVFVISSLADFQQVLAHMLVHTSQNDPEYGPIASLLCVLLTEDADNDPDNDPLKHGYTLASGPTPGCTCDVCTHYERREIGLVCLEKPHVWEWYLAAVDRFINPYWHMGVEETSWHLANRWAHAQFTMKRAYEKILKVVYASQYKPVHNGRAVAEAMIAKSRECIYCGEEDDENRLCNQCRDDIKAATWYLMLTEGCLSRSPELA